MVRADAIKAVFNVLITLLFGATGVWLLLQRQWKAVPLAVVCAFVVGESLYLLVGIVRRLQRGERL